MVLTLYPPPRHLTSAPSSRQVDVSAVSAAPVKVLTCPAKNTEPTAPLNDTEAQARDEER
jgi:hypothetical protein